MNERLGISMPIIVREPDNGLGNGSTRVQTGISVGETTNIPTRKAEPQASTNTGFYNPVEAVQHPVNRLGGLRANYGAIGHLVDTNQR